MTAHDTRTLKHELRTPINHVIGYGELLQEAALDEGDIEVTLLAAELCADGKELARAIDRHFASLPGLMDSAGVDDELRAATRDVLDRMAQRSIPPSHIRDLNWLKDFERIQLAVERLIIVMGSEF